MKITGRERKILKTIEPNVLEARLQESEWERYALVYDNTWIWHKKNSAGEVLEIKQPLKQEFDAPQLIGDAIETLAAVEERSPLEILSELITSLVDIQLEGVVSKVHGEKASETGRVTIIGTVIGKLSHIRIELKESDYNLAMKAYRQRLPVICKGDLVKDNGVFIMQNTRHFALLSGAHTEQTGAFQFGSSIAG